MKITIGKAAAVLLSGVIMSACTQQRIDPQSVKNEEDIDLKKVKREIKAMEDTLAMAYNQKDLSLFEKFYASGAVTYGEAREQIFGRKDIVAHFKTNVVNNPDFHSKFRYMTIDVFAEGDLAVETGKWVESDTTGVDVDHGFYMVIFEKQDDGQYRSIRDMWNSSISPENFPEKEE